MTNRPDRLARILIVEDDDSDAELLARQMRQCDETEEVAVSSSGELALSRLTTQASSGGLPTLILLDVNMPGMDGFAFLAALDRLAGEGDTLPLDATEPRVIVVTGSASDPHRLRALEHPRVLDYIVKPASRRDVMNVVRTARRDA